MCYDRALPHLNVAISKSPFHDVYHLLITQRSRGFSLFKLLEFNAMKGKSKGYLTYSILTVRFIKIRQMMAKEEKRER